MSIQKCCDTQHVNVKTLNMFLLSCSIYITFKMYSGTSAFLIVCKWIWLAHIDMVNVSHQYTRDCRQNAHVNCFVFPFTGVIIHVGIFGAWTKILFTSNLCNSNSSHKLLLTHDLDTPYMLYHYFRGHFQSALCYFNGLIHTSNNVTCKPKQSKTWKSRKSQIKILIKFHNFYIYKTKFCIHSIITNFSVCYTFFVNA